MKIGIDARECKKGVYTGLRTILRDFLDNVHSEEDHEFLFFCNQYTDIESLPSFGEKVIIQESNTFVWDQFLLPRTLLGKKIEVFYSLYAKTSLWRVCPYVNTISDIIPLKAPRHKGFMGFLEKVHFFLYSFICGQRSVKTITLSQDAKGKVVRTFGIGPEKIKVVYPSIVLPDVIPDPKDILMGHGIDKPYFLYVGNFKPHKNITNLINAYGLLPADIRDRYNLLLVGGSEKELSEIKRKIAGKNLDDKIIPISNVDTEAVYAFMKGADVFVFPSLAEGFGIPPVEAMASGVPVASSNLAPMTETLGDAAVFFDPESPEDISRVLLKLLKEKDLREKCIEEGRKKASIFNAKEMSEKIMHIIENAGREKSLCISSEFPPVRGGIATHIYNLWSRLPSQERAILTSRPGSVEYNRDEDMDIIRKSYPLGSDIFSRTIRAIMVIWHVLRQNALRNIKRNHCGQVLSAGLAGLLVKKLKGTPYVVYMYSADVLEFSRNFLTNWIMKKVTSGSECLIANSVFTKALITGHGLAPEDKIIV
ncbi:MAG: glycosyltransferase, partial [Candidatus Omnitrophota bacterium]